ncbi:MAG TPA: di-heme oxidoredictase family protein [Polyangia bacterium]|nr:di-heme oxidoredictase family protein [Polyangia bacterium]
MSLASLGAAIAVGAIGCLGQEPDGQESEAETTTRVGAVSLGGALPGTNMTTFAAAQANFNATETQADGLGPIFNQRSCSACHSAGAIGGAGQNVEARYGTLNSNGTFNSLAATGGSLRQLFGIGTFTPSPGLNCQSGTDANPAPGATLFAGRVTTPTFGAGLVELIPDATILAIASSQPTSIRGVARFDTIHLTDGPFVRGQSHVARFGWKAVHASVTDFAADAYMNEMGITTTSCAAGTVVNDFAVENRANRAATNAIINGCPDDDVPGVDDDQAKEDNNCAGGITDVQDDVANFAFFMRNSAAPPRGVDNSNGAGLTEFNREGCNGCHVTTTFTVRINGQNQSFQPFSDFLTHDMGSLGDGIGVNDGDSPTQQRAMRTAPLWGLRFRNALLHDARTSSVASAIKAHAGQGAAAASAFNTASSTQQNNLLLFLSSL